MYYIDVSRPDIVVTCLLSFGFCNRLNMTLRPCPLFSRPISETTMPEWRGKHISSIYLLEHNLLGINACN